MNDRTIKAITDEIAPVLTGRAMGKIFQLSRASLALDFRLGDGRLLFVSVEPSEPRIYLIERRVRELEKQALAPLHFVQVLRKHLGGATLLSLTKADDDRIVRFSFRTRDEIGNTSERTLVAQLTGKAANLLLLDEDGSVIDTLRRPRGDGQGTGEQYRPPPSKLVNFSSNPVLERGRFPTLSEAADHYYRQLDSENAFKRRSTTAQATLRREIAQREKLRRHLADDLEGHGDALEHKRIGDLLLANIGSAIRQGSTVQLIDYYEEGAPLIELEIDEHSTLQEEAARRFARYTKARSAAQQIALRLVGIEKELSALHLRSTELERIIDERDEAALDGLIGGPKAVAGGKGARKAADVPGARRYRSSDGYEVLVGRASRDNDNLTFRVARPQDLWLHTSDYPGSHVIVRNPTRADVPHRTIIEAAQLAAAFSQAKRDGKVDVHYTQRKYLSKPKGAAPGLVRMSSFRTITVEPGENIERI